MNRVRGLPRRKLERHFHGPARGVHIDELGFPVFVVSADRMRMNTIRNAFDDVVCFIGTE